MGRRANTSKHGDICPVSSHLQVLHQRSLAPSQLIVLLRRAASLDREKSYAKYGDSDFLEFVDQVWMGRYGQEVWKIQY